MIFTEGKWRPDPEILEDRALAINVEDKGLVVVSGCAHAGIINTIRYAQEVSGVNDVFAVLGGFHLAGKEFEDRIPATIQELKQIRPKLIVPCHCTGWRANHDLAKEFPTAYTPNSVGNLYQI
jgi:7,8-dihydropterin-6-yl-methyl-4-(beta-D-ribofuranosyl)aminobenzene 5'-phosphate synthase